VADIKTRELERCFTGKLRGTRTDGRHVKYTFYNEDGVMVGSTVLSHGGIDVSSKIIGYIANELGVSGPTLRGAVNCSVSRETFYQEVHSAS
jgi:hypothetical protein